MHDNEHAESDIKVMVVDDDPYLLQAIHQTLKMHKYQPDSFDRPADALASIASTGYHAVIADVKMPGINGMEFLQRVREMDQDLPVIIITGHGDVEMAVTAMKNGAYDFLEKPVDEEILIRAIARAVEKMLLIEENRNLAKQLTLSAEERSSFHGIIGRHPLMQRLYDTIEIVAMEDEPVLLSGETGTGKELVARAIHDLSVRRNSPFVAVNMGAIPPDMLEAELFGYEKGAFTGASQTKIGKFEFAGDGTLFLDEISSLPISLQAKLLRVLEECALTRLGSNTSIAVQARIIAATNCNLMEEIEAGRFRQDLYYRLNVLPITVPSLKERTLDIPLLAKHFWEGYSGRLDHKIPFFLPAALNELCRREWPGNVRELKNFVKRFCIYGKETLQTEHEVKAPSNKDTAGSMPLRQVVEEAEKEYIRSVLNSHGGRITTVCKALGISRKCLYDKINKYGLDLKSFREG